MTEPFKLALAQVQSAVGDKDANLANAVTWVAKGAEQGAGAILFPEMYLTGYSAWDRMTALAEPADGPSIRALAGVARDHSIHAVVGFPELGDDGDIYNSAALISSDGTVVGTYRKTHLFDREPAHFRPGQDLPVFETTFGTVGIAICYDLEFPEVARVLSLKGARMIFNPTANMDPYAEYQAVYLRSRAMENGVYVATANTVGRDRHYRYFGESAAVDPRGRVLCKGGGNEELLVAQMDLSAPTVETNLAYLSERRPELYAPLSDARTESPLGQLGLENNPRNIRGR